MAMTTAMTTATTTPRSHSSRSGPATRPRSRSRAGLGIGAAVLASLMLSGCFTVRTAITINDDDTVDIALAQLVDVERFESLASLFGEDVGDLSDASGEELVDDVNEGEDPCDGLIESFGDRVTSEEISEGNRRGVECTVTGVSIDEFTSFGDDDSSIVIERDGERTSIEMTLGGLEDFTDPDPEQTEFLTALGVEFEELFEVSFIVEAPGGLDTSNATSVEGSQATWLIQPGAEFVTDGRAVMTAEWSGGGSGDGIATWMLIAGAVVVAAVIAAVIALSRRRGDGDTTAAMQSPPPPPSAPPPPTPTV